MREQELGLATEADATKPPFLYEIRVKGRLDSEQWQSWFDDLSIVSGGAESTLRGSVPDHAALYGLLARLRDLAVPLVTVRVLDADAQAKYRRRGRRYDLMINLLLVAVYLLLLGALIPITVLVAPAINTALALALLGAILGAMAHAFWLWSGQVAWRWLSYAAWLASAAALLVFIPASGLLPGGLGLTITAFVLAGAPLYLLLYLRRRAENVKMTLATLPQAPSDDAAVGDRTEEGAIAGPNGES